MSLPLSRLTTGEHQPPPSALVSSYSLPKIPTNHGRHVRTGIHEGSSLAGGPREAAGAAGRASEEGGARARLMPATSLPRLPQQAELAKAIPIRSPLLALEVQLTQAEGGDEKIAVCFRALHGLLNVISQPLRPLLRLISQELMTAVYGRQETNGQNPHPHPQPSPFTLALTLNPHP